MPIRLLEESFWQRLKRTDTCECIHNVLELGKYTSNIFHGHLLEWSAHTIQQLAQQMSQQILLHDADRPRMVRVKKLRSILVRA
jgi:hypothetical protein